MNHTMLVNKTHRLPPHYVPPHLRALDIPFAAGHNDPKRLLDHTAASAAEMLFQDAAKTGLTLYGISGYRSYMRQQEIYLCARTKSYVAPPGASEHQSGLALDVSCPDVNLNLSEAFAETDEGIWLKRNVHLYGFILRYPKGKEKITGYAYEPWHIRYITKPLALSLALTHLTLEEYYDAFTTAPTDVP